MSKNVYTVHTIVQPSGETAFLPVFNWSSFSQEGVLDEYQRLSKEGLALADRVAAIAEPSFADLVLGFEDLQDRMHRLTSPVHHLKNVAANAYPGIKELEEELSDSEAAYAADIGQHEGLYGAYRRFAVSPAYAMLSAEERKIIDDDLRDFVLSGVALQEDKRKRFKALVMEAAKLGVQFATNATDSEEKIVYHTTAEDDLDGIPDKTKSVMRGIAEETKREGWAVTLRGDIVALVMMNARDRSLRETVYRANQTKASDQGPFAGENDNTPVANRLREAHHEMANILEYHNYAELAIQTRMAPSVAVVSKFLGDLASRAHKKAHDEFADLSRFAKETLGLDSLKGWDFAYVVKEYQKARLGVDPEEVRKYFPQPKVMDGLFDAIKRLYGMTLRRMDDVPSYRDDVSFYGLYDKEGNLRGGLWVDLYARAGKRAGAWADVAEYRRALDAGIQLPVGYLVCNFQGLQRAGETAYLLWNDVTTLYHECGHALHHLVTKARRSATGSFGVEWDAVELPSQFMEYFAEDLRIMRAMSAHKETGEEIPEAFARNVILADVERFLPGIYLTRQLTFGIFDWELYRDYDPDAPRSICELYEAVHYRIAVTPYYSWQRFQNAFMHIFGGGYAAGYYSYLWALALALDAKEAFDETGDLFNTVVAEKFFRKVLERGSTEKMEQMYRDFRGRDADPMALLRFFGLAS